MSKLNKKIAVIGTGNWGKNLVRNLAEIGVLHAICDKSEEAVKKQQNTYKIANAFTNYDDLLTSTDIDGIVIATPEATHYAIAKEALLAGKDVFVETPLSINLKEAQELITLAKSHDKILMVDHIFHYHPAIVKLKQLIDNG